ncbi:hypothetical protein J3F82_001595, partial [Coemansia sp. RSA 637]
GSIPCAEAWRPVYVFGVFSRFKPRSGIALRYAFVLCDSKAWRAYCQRPAIVRVSCGEYPQVPRPKRVCADNTRRGVHHNRQRIRKPYVWHGGYPYWVQVL